MLSTTISAADVGGEITAIVLLALVIVPLAAWGTYAVGKRILRRQGIEVSIRRRRKGGRRH